MSKYAIIVHNSCCEEHANDQYIIHQSYNFDEARKLYYEELKELKKSNSPNVYGDYYTTLALVANDFSRETYEAAQLDRSVENNYKWVEL